MLSHNLMFPQICANSRPNDIAFHQMLYPARHLNVLCVYCTTATRNLAFCTLHKSHKKLCTLKFASIARHFKYYPHCKTATKNSAVGTQLSPKPGVVNACCTLWCCNMAEFFKRGGTRELKTVAMFKVPSQMWRGCHKIMDKPNLNKNFMLCPLAFK